MRVWSKAISSRKLQADRVGSWLGRVAHQVRLLNASLRQAVLHLPLHLCWCLRHGFRIVLRMKDHKDIGKSQVAHHERTSPIDHENLSLIVGALLPPGRWKLRCNVRRKRYLLALKFVSAFAKV